MIVTSTKHSRFFYECTMQNFTAQAPVVQRKGIFIHWIKLSALWTTEASLIYLSVDFSLNNCQFLTKTSSLEIPTKTWMNEITHMFLKTIFWQLIQKRNVYTKEDRDLCRALRQLTNSDIFLWTFAFYTNTVFRGMFSIYFEMAEKLQTCLNRDSTLRNSEQFLWTKT